MSRRKSGTSGTLPRVIRFPPPSLLKPGLSTADGALTGRAPIRPRSTPCMTADRGFTGADQALYAPREPTLRGRTRATSTNGTLRLRPSVGAGARASARYGAAVGSGDVCAVRAPRRRYGVALPRDRRGRGIGELVAGRAGWRGGAGDRG